MDSTSTTSDIKSSQQPQMKTRQRIVLTQLARQLEFYFSKTNLSMDTYLQTLQKLNDGAVPVSILANFGKVKAILYTRNEKERYQDILTATNLLSNALTSVRIDTRTGNETQETTSTIWAIRTVDREPIDTQTTERTPFCNTIVLREVQPCVSESHVRDLFSFQDCPPIMELRKDTNCCWFVTLDTRERETIAYVMQQVQRLQLNDVPVHARLKTITPPAVDSYVLPVRIPRKKSRSKNKGRKTQKAPSLDTFPHLYQKVEWDTPLETTKLNSDGSSTATTTSLDSKSTTKPLTFADVVRS